MLQALQGVEARLSEVSGYPASHGDALEVRRYHHGAIYDSHLDSPAGYMAMSPNRTMSIVLYCSREEDYRQAIEINSTSGNLVFPLAGLPEDTLRDVAERFKLPAVAPLEWLSVKYSRLVRSQVTYAQRGEHAFHRHFA